MPFAAIVVDAPNSALAKSAATETEPCRNAVVADFMTCPSISSAGFYSSAILKSVHPLRMKVKIFVVDDNNSAGPIFRFPPNRESKC
jgi:hypothetical protein